MAGGHETHFYSEGKPTRFKSPGFLAKIQRPKPRKISVKQTKPKKTAPKIKENKGKGKKYKRIKGKTLKTISFGVHEDWELGYRTALGTLLEPMSVSSWMMKWFNLTPELTTEPGTPRTVKYQTDLLDVCGRPGNPEKVVFCKSSRSGFTTILLALCCYFSHSGRNQLFFLPKSDAVRDFGKTKMRPVMLQCEPIAAMLEEIEDRRAQSFSLFHIGGRVLRLLGMRSPANFKGWDASCIYLDEIDEASADIGSSVVGTGTGKEGQGDPIVMAMRANWNAEGSRKTFIGSTPTVVGDSHVWREYHDCSLRLSYHVECPKCKGHTPIYWENFRWDEKKTLDESSSTARYECPLCDKPWDYSFLRQAVENGRWQVPEIITTSLFGFSNEKEDSDFIGWRVKTFKKKHPILLDAEGNEQPFPIDVGFHIWSAYSLFFNWKKLVYDWLKCHTIEEKKSFCLQYRGIAWLEAAGQVQESELSKRRINLYPLPKSIRWVTGAVDVQQNFLSLLVVGWGLEGATIIQQKKFNASVNVADQGAWLDLKLWIQEAHDHLMREDGTQMSIQHLAIDSGHLTQTVYKAAGAFSMMKGLRVFCVKGRGNQDANLVPNKPTKLVTGRGSGALLWNVGVNDAKDELLSMVKENRFVLNNDKKLLPDSALEELTAERKIRRRVNGRWMISWKKIGHRNNEALDQMSYSIFMLHSVKPNLGRMNPVLRKPPDEPKEIMPKEKEKRPEFEKLDLSEETPKVIPNNTPRKRRGINVIGSMSAVQ